jgi:hypothetical protein
LSKNKKQSQTTAAKQLAANVYSHKKLVNLQRGEADVILCLAVVNPDRKNQQLSNSANQNGNLLSARRPDSVQFHSNCQVLPNATGSERRFSCRSSIHHGRQSPEERLPRDIIRIQP